MAPARKPRTKIIQSWDTAAKDGEQNDYSVCTTILVDGEDYYLLDVLRGRFDFPRLHQMALAQAERFKPTKVLVEDASVGIALAQVLRSKGRFRVEAVKVEHNKEMRFFIQLAKFEAGHVFFPRNAPFMPDLLAELLAFPRGKHDDQVDSLSQALACELKDYTSALMAAIGD